MVQIMKPHRRQPCILLDPHATTQNRKGIELPPEFAPTLAPDRGWNPIVTSLAFSCILRYTLNRACLLANCRGAYAALRLSACCCLAAEWPALPASLRKDLIHVRSQMSQASQTDLHHLPRLPSAFRTSHHRLHSLSQSSLSLLCTSSDEKPDAPPTKMTLQRLTHLTHPIRTTQQHKTTTAPNQPSKPCDIIH